MNKLYAYRGWILGALAIAMLLFPGDPISDTWLCEVLPLSAVLLVSFSILRIQARRSIGEHTRGFTHDADRLVTEGIYSRIRHPLYLSNGGVGYAFVVLHMGFQPVALVFVVALFAFEFLLSRLEDRYLESRFGDGWRKWAAATPAFIPRLTLGNKTAAPLRPERVSGESAALLHPEKVSGESASPLHPEKVSGENAAPLRPEKDCAPAKRSFLSAARADASTWFWLAVVVAIILLRKTVLSFNLLELLG
ncbi:MAG: isoprenylcysteine carboxylmethyltransferase family protein [Fibrobacter sp.]|nr:isoprenylcysteine carboxylmethyltransferase family protein [Fibrobacter sp.]